MSEIKVSVSYEKAPTTKFEALLKEYEVAKKVSDEQVSYYKPLADAAEDAKFKAILEQLETIKGYALKIAELTTSKTSYIGCYLSSATLHGYTGRDFKVVVKDGKVVVKFGDVQFNEENYTNLRSEFCNRDYNLIADWDRMKIYEGLENSAIAKLTSLIDSVKEVGERQVKRLSRVTGEGDQ